MGCSKEKCSNQSSIFSTCKTVHKCYDINMWNYKVEEKNFYLILGYSEESFSKSMLKMSASDLSRSMLLLILISIMGEPLQTWSSRRLILWVLSHKHRVKIFSLSRVLGNSGHLRQTGPHKARIAFLASCLCCFYPKWQILKCFGVNLLVTEGNNWMITGLSRFTC